MKTTSGLSRTTGRPRLRLGESGGEGFDSALSERVKLYLKVTFLINFTLTGLAFSITLSGGDGFMEVTVTSGMLWAAAATVANGMAWFLIAHGRHRAIGALLTAAITTLMLSGMYTHVVASIPDDPNPTRSCMFALITVTIVLVLRSSLIPSPAAATAVIGLLCMACPIYHSQPANTGEGWVFTTWMVALSLMVIAVTTVTSYTIYGMERRVRAAAQLGQYQIERLLGSGGMGEVYLAQHALLHRPTAIKLLRDVSGSATRDLFRHEVQTASGLTHPNTVEIYDYGRTPEGVFYFAMEYVEGATLEDVVLATGAMPPARVIHLLLQAAGSLGEAHERGLVHRDIKPSNLMLCERGGIFDTLKVMDFGLVRDLTDRKNKQADLGLTGTPLYLAPEAILQADGAVPQSDVYALGATAYFLLTGSPPFARGDLVEILSDHLAAPPPSPDCDDASLAELVVRCLSKEATDRPADARELAAALEACRDHGKWRQRDAGIWWAEHREVVAARRPGEDFGSSGGTPGSGASLVERMRPRLQRTAS